MKKERIERAIEIINYAIKNQISVREASIKSGYADTYVKNIKAIANEQYDAGILDDEQFSKFNDAYLNYIASRKISMFPEDKEIKIDAISSNEQTKFNVNGNTADIEWKGGKNYPVDHIRTLPELLKICEVDLDVWKVKDYVINKWDVTSWKSESPETIQNFQVKARLEKQVSIQNSKNAAEIFIDLVKNYTPPVFKVYPKVRSEENNLLEISIFDLHIGKLAWGGETFENYDTKIARERFLYSIQTLLQRAQGFSYNRILFPIGNDFFNSDTIFNTTTHGTQQDEDLRWQKTFRVGSRLIIDAINILKQTGAVVDVMVIPGNHDFERSYYLGEVLGAWFNNDPIVCVNNGASPRKYYRFGNVLLGFTHGSEEKESSLPLLMATDIESKPMWSETKFHEWHLGHIHRKRDVKYTVLDKSRMTNEDLGVTIRYLSSLTGTEEWHHKKGFVGSTKAADAFIWNDNLGMMAHLNSNLIIE